MLAERLLSRGHAPGRTTATSRSTPYRGAAAARARSRAASTCSTCTSRSASGCARTARSTASRSTQERATRVLRAACAKRCAWSPTWATTSSRCTWAAARRRSSSTSSCETIDLAQASSSRSARSPRRRTRTTSSRSASSRSSTRVHRFSVGVQSFDDALLKQMDRYDKYGSARGDPRAAAVDRGRVPLAQRRHDLQLPEPDRRDARARRRAAQEHRRATRRRSTRSWRRPRCRESLQAHRRRGRLRPRGALLPAALARGCATRSSPRARGRSRAPAAA